MAKEDYVVADRPDAGKTAGEKVGETVVDTPETVTGGSQSPYVDYATALNAHQSRADIETLADRRAREYGDAFADADFMRNDAYITDGTAASPPRPGTIHGDAPKSS